MTIEISKEARKEAIASIERYFRENMEEKIGNIAAGALLGYFLEELGPPQPGHRPPHAVASRFRRNGLRVKPAMTGCRFAAK